MMVPIRAKGIREQSLVGLMLSLTILVSLNGCGGGGSGGAGGGLSTQITSSVAISPRPLAIEKEGTIQFTAVWKDGSGNLIPGESVSWSVEGTVYGTFGANGLYNAPLSIPANNKVTIHATSITDPAKSDTLSFYLLTKPLLTFANSVDLSGILPYQGGSSKFKIAAFNTNLYVAWITSDQQTGTHLWYSKGDNQGNFSTAYDILPDITGYLGSNPNYTFRNLVIVSNGDPGVYIAWEDNSDGYYQVEMIKGPNSNSNGCTHPFPCFSPFVSAPGQIASLRVDPKIGSDQLFPSMAVDPAGKVEFAWTEVYSTTSQLITYKELNPDGSVSRNATEVFPSQTPTVQSQPQIGTDSAGNISISWIEYYPQFPTIKYTRMMANDSKFEPAIQVESDLLAYNDNLSMAVDAQGYPYIAWSNSYSSINTTGIYYSTTTDFKTFFNPVQISSTGSHPTIKVDFLLNLYFTWEDGANFYFEKMNSASGLATTPVRTFSGMNPEMDIDYGGRVYLLFTNTDGSNFSNNYLTAD